MKRKNNVVETPANFSLPIWAIGSFADPDFSDLVFYDFTTEAPEEKAHIDDILPLPRGGQFLHRYDLIKTAVLDFETGEVDYYVVGTIEAWNDVLVTIKDRFGVYHYVTLEACEEEAQKIAAADGGRGYVQLEKEMYEYVQSIEAEAVAA